MEDVALIEPFTNSDDILKKMSVSTLHLLLLHTDDSAADKSTSAAIFPPLEFMKVTSHLSPAVVFFLEATPRAVGKILAIKLNLIKVCLLYRLSGLFLREHQQEKWSNHHVFLLTGKTESVRFNAVYVISSPVFIIHSWRMNTWRGGF